MFTDFQNSFAFGLSSDYQWRNQDFFQDQDQDQDLNFKTKTKILKFFQDQDQDQDLFVMYTRGLLKSIFHFRT